ncbi:hypothetical protein Cgig2_033634 [Carnegiea gigantea]|uniref:Uncharacterized protein n=1 Tax=Carnegiea gigantea TaxID=171969 RepID=A0A9Q1QC20_9CARY|nr:hypothetical protein Cgig2_033634 [Carnegiea gigantea]
MCEDSSGIKYEAHDEEEEDGDSDLSFSIFDVILLTSLQVARKAELDGDKVTIDVRQIVWFNEHTIRFVDQDKKRYPCIACWARVDHGGGTMQLNFLRILKRIRLQVFTMTMVIPVLYQHDTKLVYSTVTQFIATDEFSCYEDDGWLSVDKLLRSARDVYLMEKKAH